MKTIRIAGLGIFVLSILIFISTLFLGSFSLSENAIQRTFKGKNPKIIENFTKIAQSENVLNENISNPFNFINDKIAPLIEKYNAKTTNDIALEKGLSSSEIESILSTATVNNQVNYSKSILETIFKTQPEKIAIVDNATNWMYTASKKYDKIEDFKNDFKSKIEDINKTNASEFLIYDNKYVRYDIAKAASIGVVADNKWLFLFLTFGLGIIGSIMFIVSALFLEPVAGIKNNGIYLQAATNRGWVGFCVFGFLVTFYVLLYFYPHLIIDWTNIVDPLKAIFVKDGVASQWFLYGILYCSSMIVMGIRMFIKYRHNQYQIVRTASVLFFQIIFAFLLVEILPLFGLPGVDLKNAWPLDYNFATDWNVKQYLDAGHLGKFMFFWGIILSIVVVPTMVYFFGKRWYCSWVCGCGGLAETLGDPYRQLSDKRLIAWKIERWTIYPILVFAIIMTIVVGFNTYNIIMSPENVGDSSLLGINAYKINEWYGFFIGSIFSGIIGTGFYPILGNRTWCRFGCPLAAYMGLVQRFKSKFRITTNGGQCISCGNCSTYCEQGIDVRAYAQKGENIVRSSCVGCGICSAVCPRGVLKLENTSEKGRINSNDILLGNDLNLVDLLNQK